MTNEFILCTAELASRAPEPWAKFLAEYTAYADGLTKGLMHAPPNDFARLQGRAVHADQLLDHFKNARANAARIMRKP
jgi:hypothetical protein